MNIIIELKRRNVFKVGIAYVVVAWLVLQVADIVFDAIGTPDWVMQTLLVILLFGLAFTLFFAWAFELTPDGLKREKDVDRSQSVAPQTGRKLDFAIIGLLAIALGYFIWESRFADTAGVESPTAPSESAESTGATADEPPGEAPGRPSIAVLPFDNRSADAGDSFFVAGIHDDLLTNLARIGNLKVISRTSVERYADTALSIPDIARELDVATVMEGAVQRSGDNVRINVQLIDARTDEHLWAEIYDRQLTADNLFAIQTEISEAIAQALKATLSPEERQRISTTPTQDMAAYNAYLQGRQWVKSRDSESLARATEAFERALAADPDFAQAWIGRAEAAIYSSVYGALKFEDALEIYGESGDRALAINPDLGEAWAIRGAWLMNEDRYSQAEPAFRKALELSPSDANVHKLYAEFLRLNPARSLEALDRIDQAIQLDPYWIIPRTIRGGVLQMLGRLDAAEAAFRDTIELDPGSSAAHNMMAIFLLTARGDLEQALDYAETSRRLDDGSPTALYTLAHILLDLDHPEAIDDLLDDLHELTAQRVRVAYVESARSIYNGQVGAALESMRSVADGQLGHNFDLYLGRLYAMNGRHREALDFMLRGNPEIRHRDQWGHWLPRHPAQACLAGWLFERTGEAELGRALYTASLSWLEDTMLPMLDDAHLEAVDQCLAVAGETERALDALEARLAHGHIDEWWTIPHDPVYTTLRDDPRFLAAWTGARDTARRQRDALLAEGRL